MCSQAEANATKGPVVNNNRRPETHPALYGDGHTADRCLALLETVLLTIAAFTNCGRAPTTDTIFIQLALGGFL